jgi:hypothetical protein
VVAAPLTRCVLTPISVQGPFPTIEAGLLLVDVMLVALFAASLWVWIQLGRRAKRLREACNRP